MEIKLTKLDPTFAAKVDKHVMEVTNRNKKIPLLPHILKCANCYNNALRIFWVTGKTHEVLTRVPEEIRECILIEEVIKGKLIDGEPYIILNGEIVNLKEIPHLLKADLKLTDDEAQEMMFDKLESLLDGVMAGHKRAEPDGIFSMFGQQHKGPVN